MNKEKSFAKELAELINRHGIDAKFNTADYLLADLAIDALNAYGTTKRKQEIRENPELDTRDCPACQMRRALEAKEAARPKPGKKEYKKPEAFDVPKEVQAMAEFFGEMFPGSKVEIHRVEMPRRKPRDKRRGKNKRKGERRNE